MYCTICLTMHPTIEPKIHCQPTRSWLCILRKNRRPLLSHKSSQLYSFIDLGLHGHDCACCERIADRYCPSSRHSFIDLGLHGHDCACCESIADRYCPSSRHSFIDLGLHGYGCACCEKIADHCCPSSRHK